MPSTRSSAAPEGTDHPVPTARPHRRVLLLAVVALVLVVVVAAGAVVVVTADDGEPPPPAGRPGEPFVAADGDADPGTAAPDFALPLLDGDGVVGLADFAGRPVVVNFWASWCNPCREEFPLLARARDRHADAGLEVLGVTYRDIASDSRAFATAQDADWPLLRDPGGALAARYGVRAIPQTFFVAPDGTLVSRVFGITSEADLEAEIRRILPERR